MATIDEMLNEGRDYSAPPMALPSMPTPLATPAPTPSPLPTPVVEEGREYSAPGTQNPFSVSMPSMPSEGAALSAPGQQVAEAQAVNSVGPGAYGTTAPSDVPPSAQPAATQEEPLAYNASGVPEPEQIPSGPIVTQKTTSGTVYKPENIAAIEEATKELNTHLENQKKVYEALGEAQKPWFDKLAAARIPLEAMLDSNSPEMKAFRRDVATAKEKIETASADLAEFQKNVKVDPMRYYKETPFLQHALNSVAMLFEGNTASAMIRAGLPAPTGMVQARIDKAINDDIARQKEEFKSKEAGMANTINRYRDNLKLLGDERAAEYKTRVELLMMTQNTLNAITDRFQNDFNVQNIEGIKKQNLLNLEKAKGEMNKANVQTLEETPKIAPRTAEMFVNVGGVDVKARTAEDAKAIKDLAIPTIQGMKAVQRLKELSEKMGPLSYAGWPDEVKAEAESQALIAKMLFKDIYKLGAWDAGGAAVLEEKVPKANTIGFILKKYDTLIDEMQTAYASTLNQRTVRNDFTSKDVGNAINADLVRLYGKQKK